MQAIVRSGKLVKRRKGVPQGSPLSPLLSNILLNELIALEKQGLKFVRYADDFSIYTKSKAEAQKVGNVIFMFLRDKNANQSGAPRAMIVLVPLLIFTALIEYLEEKQAHILN